MLQMTVSIDGSSQALRCVLRLDKGSGSTLVGQATFFDSGSFVKWRWPAGITWHGPLTNFGELLEETLSHQLNPLQAVLWATEIAAMFYEAVVNFKATSIHDFPSPAAYSSSLAELRILEASS